MKCTDVALLLLSSFALHAISHVRPIAAANTYCKLNYTTITSGPGATSIVCTGEHSITAHTADPRLESNSRGVTWEPKGCPNSTRLCIFKICSTAPGSLVVMDISVDYPPSSASVIVRAFVCAAGRSHVTMPAAVIKKTGVAAVEAHNQATVVLDNAWLEDNGSGAEVGGAVYAMDDSTVIIRNGTYILKNSAYQRGAGIAAAGNSKVTIDSSFVFTNFVGPRGIGGAGVASLGNATVTIANGSILQGNGVTNLLGWGAGIWADEQSTVIVANGSSITNHSDVVSGAGAQLTGRATLRLESGSSISNNQARLIGGGVHAGNLTKLIISGNSSVSECAADRDGGGVYLSGSSSLRLLQSSISNNHAESCGGGIYVREAAAVEVSGGSRIAANEALLMGGGVYALGNGSIRIHNSMIDSNTAQDAGGGLYIKGKVAAMFEPGAAFSNNWAAQSGTEDVRAWPDNNLDFDSRLTFDYSSPNITWTRVNCKTGEVPGRNSYCTPCLGGTFSFDTSLGCSVCPVNANCTGGSDLRPLAQYWRSGPYSTQVHACVHRDACLADGVCAQGYKGNLCGTCDEDLGYGSSGHFRCVKCMSSKAAIVGIWLLGAALLLSMICLMLRTTLRDNQDISLSSADRVARPSDFLKVLIKHAQYLLIISSLKVPWAASIGVLFKAVSLLYSVSSSELISLDCLLSDSPRLPPKVVQRQLVYLLAPWAFFALAALCCFVAEQASKLHRRLAGNRETRLLQPWGSPQQQLTLVHKLPALALIVVFFFYPMLVRSGLVMFACYDIDDASNPADPYRQYAVASARFGYWVAAIDQACWEGWHKQAALAIGIPCTLFFCVVVPCGIFLFLYFNRSKLHDKHFAERVGFLYHNYKDDRWFWEAVVAVQTVLLVLVAVFSYTLGAFYASLLLSIILLGFITMEHAFQPHAVLAVHRMQRASNCCLLFTCFIAQSLFNADGARVMSYPDFISWVGLLVNLGFVVWCCYSIVRSSAVAFAQAWTATKTWVVTRSEACFEGMHAGVSKDAAVAAAVPIGWQLRSPSSAADAHDRLRQLETRNAAAAAAAVAVNATSSSSPASNFTLQRPSHLSTVEERTEKSDSASETASISRSCGAPSDVTVPSGSHHTSARSSYSAFYSVHSDGSVV